MVIAPPPTHMAPVTALHPDIGSLRGAAKAEGFRFLDRLVDEWNSGANRFDQPGEQFLGAFVGETLVGVCGLNRDPYLDQDRVARLRHLYVTPGARRVGVARVLVVRLLHEAVANFDCVRLRTTQGAALFYERHGFVAIDDETATHRKFVFASLLSGDNLNA